MGHDFLHACDDLRMCRSDVLGLSGILAQVVQLDGEVAVEDVAAVVTALAVGTIVAGEEDQRIVELPQAVEQSYEIPNLRVEVLHHRREGRDGIANCGTAMAIGRDDRIKLGKFRLAGCRVP